MGGRFGRDIRERLPEWLIAVFPCRCSRRCDCSVVQTLRGPAYEIFCVSLSKYCINFPVPIILIRHARFERGGGTTRKQTCLFTRTEKITRSLPDPAFHFTTDTDRKLPEKSGISSSYWSCRRIQNGTGNYSLSRLTEQHAVSLTESRTERNQRGPLDCLSESWSMAKIKAPSKKVLGIGIKIWRWLLSPARP